MSDELSQLGTGERGIVKVERPKYDAKPVLNKEILDRELVTGRWIYDENGRRLVPLTQSDKKHVHAVITDEIEPTEYLGSGTFGEIYTSKKKLEERTHRDGFFIPSEAERKRMKPLSEHKVEFEADEKYRQQMRDDWDRASNDVKYGNVEFSEKEKQQCLEEERNYKRYKARRKARGF